MSDPNLPVVAADASPVLDIDRKSTSKKVLPTELYATRARAIKTSEITVSMMETFLDELEKTGLWELSARRCGMNARSIRKIKQMDSDFEAMCNDAMAAYVDRVEGEAHRRAVEGWDEPVFSHKLGTQIGTIRKYDGKLLELILKRHIPEFREKFEGEIKVSGGVIVVPIKPASQAEWVEAASRPSEPKVVESKVVDNIIVTQPENSAASPTLTPDNTTQNPGSTSGPAAV